MFHIPHYLRSRSVSPDVRDAYFGSLDKAFEGFTFVDDSAAQYMTGRSSGRR